MDTSLLVGCILGFLGGFVAGVTAGPFIRQAFSGAVRRIPRPEARMMKSPRPHPNWYARWAPTIMAASVLLIGVSLIAAIAGIMSDRQQDRERVQSTVNLLNCFSEWGDDVVGATGAVRGASADRDEALRTALATLQATILAASQARLTPTELDRLIDDLAAYQRLNKKLARTRVENPVPAPLRERCADLIEETEPAESDERVVSEPLPSAERPTPRAREPRQGPASAPVSSAAPLPSATAEPTAAPAPTQEPPKPTRTPRPSPSPTVTAEPEPQQGLVDTLLEPVRDLLDTVLGE